MGLEGLVVVDLILKLSLFGFLVELGFLDGTERTNLEIVDLVRYLEKVDQVSID